MIIEKAWVYIDEKGFPIGSAKEGAEGSVEAWDSTERAFYRPRYSRKYKEWVEDRDEKEIALELTSIQKQEHRKRQKERAEGILMENIATDYLTSDKLTEEQKKAFTALYEPWVPGKAYAAGDKVEFEDGVYEVIQPHVSQLDWTPETVPALFKVVYQTETSGGTVVIPEFVQPTGAHDAYSIGDRVMFNGTAFESTIDGNIWTPSGYPQGWKQI